MNSQELQAARRPHKTVLPGLLCTAGWEPQHHQSKFNLVQVAQRANIISCVVYWSGHQCITMSRCLSLGAHFSFATKSAKIETWNDLFSEVWKTDRVLSIISISISMFGSAISVMQQVVKHPIRTNLLNIRLVIIHKTLLLTE